MEATYLGSECRDTTRHSYIAPVNLGHLPTACRCNIGEQGERIRKGIVESCHNTTVSRIGHLHHIDRASRSSYCDTQAQKKASTHELTASMIRERRPLDHGSNHDKQSTKKHSHFTAPIMDCRCGKRGGDDITYLMHG